jgi:hypothetical protein
VTDPGLRGELIASDVVLTNMRGVYSDHIADHVFEYILTYAFSTLCGKIIIRIFRPDVRYIRHRLTHLSTPHLPHNPKD